MKTIFILLLLINILNYTYAFEDNNDNFNNKRLKKLIIKDLSKKQDDIISCNESIETPHYNVLNEHISNSLNIDIKQLW